jgi:hypothetical protein
LDVHENRENISSGKLQSDSKLNPMIPQCFQNVVPREPQNGGCRHRQLNLILQLTIGLICRLPAKPSMKWMTSWWLSVAEAPAEVAKMDGAAKKTMLSHINATFDGLRKAAVDPVVFLDVLPENPVSFLRDSPDLYKASFVGDPPVVPAMDIKLIAALDMSDGCRGDAAKLQPQPSAHLALLAAAVGRFADGADGRRDVSAHGNHGSIPTEDHGAGDAGRVAPGQPSAARCSLERPAAFPPSVVLAWPSAMGNRGRSTRPRPRGSI